MICAAIWGGGHTEIYLTNRDSESTQGGKGERGYSKYSVFESYERLSACYMETWYEVSSR